MIIMFEKRNITAKDKNKRILFGLRKAFNDRKKYALRAIPTVLRKRTKQNTAARAECINVMKCFRVSYNGYHRHFRLPVLYLNLRFSINND